MLLLLLFVVEKLKGLCMTLNLNSYFNLVGQDQKLRQLAQFSTSEQITASSLQSNQALQASALVGRKVLIPSECLKLEKKGEVPAIIDIPLDARDMNIFIYNDQAQLIKTISVTLPDPGLFQFSWDGTDKEGKPVPEGRYCLNVRGFCQGEELPFDTLIFANVNSVCIEQHEEGIKLNVEGAEPISLDQVRQIIV
jgi:flagellar basal-body rod modification protein FlgD